jgi:hypothetical protein
LMLVISVYDVVSKNIGIGDLQYNLSMITRLREQASGLMTDINSFLVDNTRMSELRDLSISDRKANSWFLTNRPRLSIRSRKTEYSKSSIT